ncbi:MAG: transcription elongation factor GreA [Clostridiales bacterium]|nr:transcription elongation factor GreA [Clostridiales bacterium]
MAEEKRNIMTEEGLRKLQEQLDFLVGVRRNEVAHKIEVARGFGDLSENAEYDEAKKEQGQLEEEIARLTKVISTAVVVSESEISTDKVSVGVTVKVQDMETGDTYEYAIVGAEEADPYEDKISNESPVGAALMGATVGTVLDIEVPMGMLKYKVLEIKR